MQPTTLALILSLLGISILFSLTFLPPHEINSEKELSALTNNQNAITTGKVIKISSNKAIFFIDLDNNITISTTFPTSVTLQKKKIRVLGKKEEYAGKSQLRAQQIMIEL